MEKINEKIEWSDVELLEDGMILTGGEEGTANEQAKALANRTAWLKETVKSLKAKDILTTKNNTVQAELDQKSDTNHTHAGGGLAPEIKVVDAGKVLAINKEGTGTEWQIVSGNPVGTIIAWAGLTPPAGYLECAGQILRRDIYKDLFQAIGTVWGTTGTDDFKLPDFKSAARFLRSRGDGLEVGEVQGDTIRNIEGNIGVTQDPIEGAFSKGVLSGHIAAGTYAIHQAKFKASNVVPTANENRPKNAVVMYCIKAVDEYINPAQVDMAKVAEENAKKAYREDVKELAGARLWVSGEYQPVLNTPTIVEHGLNIDPLRCQYDVLLVCKVAESGYQIGEVAMGGVNISTVNSTIVEHSLVPFLSGQLIQYNTGNNVNSLHILNKSNGARVTVTLSTWRYIFRIWY